MAPRKAELLDLMRKQRAADQPSAGRTESSPQASSKPKKERPAEKPAAADSRSATRPVRSSSPRGGKASGLSGLPWGGIALVLLIAIPMVYWLSGVFGGEKLEAGPSPGNQDPAAAAGNGAVAAEAPYSVVAVEYRYSAGQVEHAITVGKELIRQLGVWGTVADDQENWIRIYLGRASSSKDPELADIQSRLQQLEYPAGSGKRAFESAYIARLPASSS